jgi:ribosomal protein S27E
VTNPVTANCVDCGAEFTCHAEPADLAADFPVRCMDCDPTVIELPEDMVLSWLEQYGMSVPELTGPAPAEDQDADRRAITRIYCDWCDKTIYYAAHGNDELLEAAERGEPDATAELARIRLDLLTSHQMECAA